MVNIFANSNRVQYGIKRYIIDEESEVEELPIWVGIGSIAFVTSTSAQYMLNGSRHWVKISTGGGGQELHYIYDGGSVDFDPTIETVLIYDGGQV